MNSCEQDIQAWADVALETHERAHTPNAQLLCGDDRLHMEEFIS